MEKERKFRIRKAFSVIVFSPEADPGSGTWSDLEPQLGLGPIRVRVRNSCQSE